MLVKTDLWRYGRIATHVWMVDEHIPDPTTKLYYAIDIDLNNNETWVPDTAFLGIKSEVLHTGTALGGSASLIALDAGASSVNDFYKWMRIVITSGTGAGQTRQIYSYDGAIKSALVIPDWSTNPDNTSVFKIYTSNMRVITGRPEYDGTPTLPTYEGGAENPWTWHQGILEKDKINNSSINIDIPVHGDVGTLSGFKFAIKDCDKQYKWINKSNIYFTGRPVTHYVVINSVFYPIWSGVIQAVVYKDEDVIFSCVGAFNAIHKEMPPRSAVPPEFPNAPEADSAATIPICFGDIPDAQLVLVNKQFTYQDITGITNREYYAGTFVYTLALKQLPKIEIITWDKTFTSNELQGKWLMFINGGGNVDKNKILEITANNASFTKDLNVGVGTLTKNVTEVYLSEQASDYADIAANYDAKYKACFDPTGCPYPITPARMSGFWMVAIIDFVAEYKISNSSIYGLLRNSLGNPTISLWNEQRKAFDDISQMFEYTNFLTGDFKLKPKLLAGEKSAKYNTYLRPEITAIIDALVYPDNIVFEPVPNQTITGTIASLTDKDRKTGVVVSRAGGSPTFNYSGVCFAIKNTEELQLAAQSGGLGIAVDLDINGLGAYYVSITTLGRDAYHNVITGDPNWYRWAIDSKRAKDVVVDSDIPDGDFNELDDDYYALDGDAQGEHCRLPYIHNTADGVRTVQEFRAFDSDFTAMISDQKFAEIWVCITTRELEAPPTLPFGFKVKQIALVQSAEVPFENDKIAVKVQGEASGGGMTNSIYKAVEHIAEQYDEIPVTKINTNNLSAVRNTWHVGRQVSDKQSSLDYIREICQQGMIGYWQDRNGILNYKSWLDDKVIKAFHDNTEVLRNSIKGIKYTNLNKTYNEFSIRYGFNNITDEYEKELYIAHADALEFPASGDATWKNYVGGIDTYATAKALWDICHAAWQKTLLKQKLVIDCPWYIDGTKFTGAPTGTGESAYKLLSALVNWATVQKESVTYEVYLNPATIALDLLDYVSFKDIHLTDASYRGGWIVSIANTPKKNTRKLTLIIDPDPA